jgi:apolipoprotein N-acyltransferase
MPDGPQLRPRFWRWTWLVGTALLWGFLAVGASWRGTPPASAGANTTLTAQVPGDSLAAAGSLARSLPLPVAVVQANVSLQDKWTEGRIDSSRIPYTNLTAEATAAGAELVVWAETAVPAYLMYDRELLGWVKGLVAGQGIFLYTGFPDARLRDDGNYLRYNSSALFAPDGTVQAFYAKHHLLPIGEAMPFQKYLPWLGHIDVGQAEWSPGDPPQPITVATGNGEVRFAGLICYESIFWRLSLQAVRRGAEILINITNDGWFRKTAGPRQHAALARFRAAECGVPLVRCANNGISFIADQKGRILTSAGLGRRATLSSDVTPGREATLVVRAGMWPLLSLLAVWCVLVLAASGRRKRS